MKVWCKNNNVSTGQYYYWIKKLNNNIDSEVTENTSAEWEEVVLAPQQQTIDSVTSITLSYNNFKLEIPKNIKRADIAEVLAAIVSVC